MTTREEAEAIYDGELPEYIPPEGYELEQIEVSPGEARMYYEDATGETGFSIYAQMGYTFESVNYICEDGSARLVTGPIAETYPLDDGTAYSAYVSMPDGEQLTFDFDDAVDADAMSEVLGGLTK